MNLELVLMLSFLALVVVLALSIMGTGIAGLFERASLSMASLSEGGSPPPEGTSFAASSVEGTETTAGYRLTFPASAGTGPFSVYRSEDPLVTPGDPGTVLVGTANADTFIDPGMLLVHSYRVVDANGEASSPLAVPDVLTATSFAVPPVNRLLACPRCHDASLANTHPYHNPVANCGAICHGTGQGGFGSSTVARVPTLSSAYGAFATTSSAEANSGNLHAIHAIPSWPSTISYGTINGKQQCAPCHAAASCESCHDNVPLAVHQQHGSTDPAIIPWTGPTSSGAAGGSMYSTTGYSASDTVRCGSPQCHDAAGTAPKIIPWFMDGSSHGENIPARYLANTVTKTGTWTSLSNMNYTMGTVTRNATAGSTLSLTFTGEKFKFKTSVGPTFGKAEIFIDDVSQGVIDLYASGAQRDQVIVYTSPDLPRAAHTIKVKVLGQKTAASTSNYVYVDQFEIYQELPGSLSPTCVSCHPA